MAGERNDVERAYKYRAFISYSHRDERWAAWLHHALETYHVPKALVGQTTDFGAVPPRISPVFRDRDELASATDLGEVLTQALRDSACQIVICSPASARSRWVNEEVLTFKRFGRASRVFCLIVDGEPNAADAEQEAFPEAVRYKLADDGSLGTEPAEPIAADARPGKDGKPNAKLKIVAGMLGVGLDALKQREQHRRQKRLAIVAAASVVGMLVASGLAATAWFARLEAEAQRTRAEAEAETAKQTTDFMVNLFKVSDPSESLGNKITAREILDKGAKRIETELTDQPKIQATLMDTMGTVYTSLGLYKPAVSLLEQALAKRRDVFGAEDLNVASSLNHLGEVLTLAGNYSKAEQNLQQALQTRNQLSAPHAEIARTIVDLADVKSFQGKYDNAVKLSEQALEIRQKLYGKTSNPDIADSLEELGVNQYYVGDYTHAIDNLRAALKMRRAIYPGVHPKIAEALNNLALALHETGKYAEAESLYTETLAMTRRLLGPKHKDIAAALINVAGTLEDEGKYKAAEADYREALSMQKSLLGPEHPDVVKTMNGLAFDLYEEGHVPEATKMMRDTLSLATRVLGDNHPDVAQEQTNLAYFLILQKQYSQAGPLLDKALAIRRHAFGDSHPLVASTLSIKANLLLATGHFEQARETAEEARKILIKNFSDTHWRVAVAGSVEGAALTGLGKYRQAETLLTASAKILRQDGAPMEELKHNQERLDHLYAVWHGGKQ